MNRLQLPWLLAAALILGGCHSAPPPGTPAALPSSPLPPVASPRISLPARSEIGLALLKDIAHANAVYLANVERRADGLVHYAVAEVWRHDPNLGRTPPLGADVMEPRPDSPNKPRDQVIIFISGGSRGPTTHTTSVTDGFLNVDRIPLGELRAAVAKGAPDASIAPTAAAKLAESLAHAHGIYLARVERADGQCHYLLIEVWRHDPKMGPPPPRDYELFSQPDRIPSVGDTAVLFVNSAKPFSPGTALVNRTVGVFHGFVTAFSMSLDEFRERVAAQTAP